MNTKTFAANWPVAREKLKRKYAQLTDGDLTFVEGREEEFIDRIQAKTGAAREDLERYLREECHCW